MEPELQRVAMGETHGVATHADDSMHAAILILIAALMIAIITQSTTR